MNRANDQHKSKDFGMMEISRKPDEPGLTPVPSKIQRRELLGLGSVIAALTGCAENTSPSRSSKKNNSGTTGTPGNKDVGRTTQGTVKSDCACMSPPAAPPATSPPIAINPPTTVPTAPPTTPPPVASPPATQPPTTTPPGTGLNGGTATVAFKVLSASNAQIRVVDDPMMGGGTAPAPSITMADGKKILVWGLVEAASGLGFNGRTVTPGPVLEMVEGQPVAVTLTAMMPHTMHWHGLDVPTAVDGDPDTSGWVGMMPAERVDPAKGLGSSFTYRFTAPPAGTYFYHCHVDTVVHMEMGMMGCVVVRPPGTLSQVFTNGPVFQKEYIWQLHTMDSTWHKPGHVVSDATNFRYRPDYFMINGMDGANLMADASTAITAMVGEKVLIRLVNFGYLAAEVWLGGQSFLVASSDGRPLRQEWRTDKLLMSAGERYDIVLDATVAVSVSPEVRYYDASVTKVLGKAMTSLIIA